jgi:hypothetical protein
VKKKYIKIANHSFMQEDYRTFRSSSRLIVVAAAAAAGTAAVFFLRRHR